MTYGVTENGFVLKSYNAIIEAAKQRAKQYFGEDIDLSENSPILQFANSILMEAAILWNVAEDIYYSAFIDFATGKSLDYIAALIGYTRIAAAKATGTVTFSRSTPASEDIIIPAGTRVSTSDGSVVFKTTQAVTLTAGLTSVDAQIEAVEPGSQGNVAANTISVIVDPVSGIEAVNNANPTEDGRDTETDEEFRLRIKTTIQSIGKATLDAILARVRSVEGVKSAKIEENDTMNDNTGTGGLPPKSFRVFVYGGDNNDIAQAIFDAKPAGIQPYGDVSGTAYDVDGNEYTIYFARPTEVEIHIEVQATTDGTSVTEQEIKDAIKAYFDTLELGDDVIYNKVVAAVMSIQGIVDATVKIDTTSPPAGTSNIAIADSEIAITDDTKITVTIS